MNKLLVISILGMAIAGAVVLLMIPMLFSTPVPPYAVPTVAGAGFVVVFFAISTFTWRRRSGLGRSPRSED